MSPVSVICSHCQAKFAAKPQLAGKRVKCPKCGGAIDVPQPEVIALVEVECPMCLTDFAADSGCDGGSQLCPTCGAVVPVGDASGGGVGPLGRGPLGRGPLDRGAADPLGFANRPTLAPARVRPGPTSTSRTKAAAFADGGGLQRHWPSGAVVAVALLSFLIALFTHRLTHGVVLLVAGVIIAGVGVIFPAGTRRPRKIKKSWAKSVGSSVGVAFAVMGWLLIQAQHEGRSARFMGYFVGFLTVAALLVYLVAGYVWAVIRFGFFRPTAVVYGLFALGLPALWIAFTPRGFETAALPRSVDVRSEPLPQFPELGPAQEVDTGVSLRECRLQVAAGRPGRASRILVYTPTGDHAAHSLPCVFITGAGAFPFTGMELGGPDTAEHTPYVQAGFAVVAYEIDGFLAEAEQTSDQQYLRALEKYWAAQAGIVNARNAIEFALAKVPQIDPARLYTAGHSSAAVQALLLAANDSRIRGCVAYAPVSDYKEHSDELVRNMRRVLSGFDDLLQMASPCANEAKLNCPVFLFHAQDDSNVAVSQSMEMAERLQAAGKQVKLVTVPYGDHYDSMISQGIPQGTAWLCQLAGVTNAPLAGAAGALRGRTPEPNVSADPSGPLSSIPTGPFGSDPSVPTGPIGSNPYLPPDPFGPGPNTPTYPSVPNPNGMPSMPGPGYVGPPGPGPGYGGPSRPGPGFGGPPRIGPGYGGPPGTGPGYGGPSRPMPPSGPRMPGRRR